LFKPQGRRTDQRGILPRIRRELPETKALRELLTDIDERMLKTAKITSENNRKGKEDE
jgi:hypothetical protein